MMKIAQQVVFSLLVLSISCKSPVKVAFDETYVVKKVNLRDIVSQSGEVKPVVKIDLKSESSGKIERVLVKEGQQVRKGDTILCIDPSRLITQKKKLELSVRESEIEYEKSNREFSSGKELFKNGSLSEKQLFDFQVRHQLDSINLKRQELELVDIIDQLKKTVIVSPMSGVITSLAVEAGEIAISATGGFQNGTEIATIADIHKLEVITTIGEVDYINIKQGQSVIVRPEAIENVKTKGIVSFVALSAKKDEKNDLSGFEVRITIDSIIPGIAPGINVTVEFTIREKENVIGIPYHFVQKNDSIHFAHKMVLGPSGVPVLKKLPITVGATDFKFYEVTSGVQVGDTIVLLKQDLSDKKSDDE